MKTKVLSLVMLLTLAFSLSVSATARWDGGGRATPKLSFSGTTANCAVKIVANDSNAKISATMVLYRVNSNGQLTFLQSWGNLNGTGSVSAAKTYSACTKGTTYELAILGTITDSTGNTPISASKQVRCP